MRSPLEKMHWLGWVAALALALSVGLSIAGCSDDDGGGCCAEEWRVDDVTVLAY